MSSLKTLLWISVSPLQQSSFGIVSHNLLSRLKGYRIYYLAQNYYGKPQELENYVLCQLSSSKQISEYLKALNPSIVAVYQSPFVQNRMSHVGDEIKRKAKLIVYVPIEGFPLTCETTMLEKADLILTPSKFSQACLQKEGFQAKVLPHGVDTSTFKPQKSLEQKFSEANRFNFGTLGSHVWRKQLPNLIDAYGLALKYGMKNTNYYVCASTYDKSLWMPDLNKYTKKMEIPVKFSRVAMLNLPVTVETITSFYNMLHCHLLPTSESFGLPTLEAMACGTVPIVIRHGASPEIVGDCGLYAQIQGFLATEMGRFAMVDVKNLAQIMKWATEHPESLLKLAKKGMERATQFPWEKAGNQLQKHLEKLT